MPGQRLRADRLAVADVARDQGAQQLARARIEVRRVGGGPTAGCHGVAGYRSRGARVRVGKLRLTRGMAPRSRQPPTAQSRRMLTRLSIKDFAVVAAAELEFGPGMTVISGETGAGKSLLVDALGFLSGLRADSGVVRHGAERAELDARIRPRRRLAGCARAGCASRSSTTATAASCAARSAPTAARGPGSTAGR